MKRSLFTKLLSLFLAILTVLGVFATTAVFADEETDGQEPVQETAEAGDEEDKYPGYYDDYVSLEEMSRFADLSSYESYTRKHSSTPKTTKNVLISAVDYDKEKTTAKVEVKEKGYVGCETSSLYMNEGGQTVWTVEIPETAMYAIRINYYSVEGHYTTIERMLYIDDKLPFTEARYFYFPRSWKYEGLKFDEATGNIDFEFEQDVNGNDIRPRREEDPKWTNYFLRDWLGYTQDPFEFYFTQGTHTITLEGSREPMLISSIELYRYEGEADYADFLAQKKAEGAKVVTGQDKIIVEAEEPINVSNACLFPANDRTSCLTTPQNPSTIKYNMLDSSVVNHWMTYKVTVKEAGLYNIACRYRQNSLIGMFTSRRLYINDEIQFRQASFLRFTYSPEWQCNIVSDGSGEPFLFYLKEGVNEIKVELVLGEMTEYVYRIERMIDELNLTYQKLLKITGPTPDSYRDYGFARIAPDAIKSIGDAANELFKIADELEEITGALGDQVQTLNTIGLMFELMAEDEYEIAPHFITFKNYIIALSNWLYASLSQPLKVDKWIVMCEGDKLPQAKSNFFQQSWFEIRAFVKSFTMDYTTIGRKSDVVLDKSTEVEMWIVSAGGREDALIQRYLIDNYFTPKTNISVTIKVISAGLTEAILAGIGPDISSMGSNDCITWGMRNAVEDLSAKKEDGSYRFEGFEEVQSWFDPATTKMLTMEGKTYGIPTGMSFNMMFYRADVLAENGLEAPETWEELYAILPALMNQHLEICMPATLDGVKLFVYQHGETLYDEEDTEHLGWAINLDDKTCLSAFSELMDFFTKYKCDVGPDITRFRTGEIPIWIGDAVGTYNTLMSFYELRGLWQMVPLPGVRQEDGTINRTSVATVSAFVIPRGANNPESTWEYIKWYMSEETQLLLYKETLNVNANPTVKTGTPNIAALRKEAWTEQEYTAIEAQIAQLDGVPEYPGNYIVSQYVSNAFYDVYNNNTDPINAMQDRVLDINKEISRKRKEFKLDYYEITYNKSENRDLDF